MEQSGFDAAKKISPTSRKKIFYSVLAEVVELFIADHFSSEK